MDQFQPHLSQPYLQVRGMYDTFMGGNTSIGAYNQLAGSIYSLKASYELPDGMYHAVNNMQYQARQQLGGLENML